MKILLFDNFSCFLETGSMKLLSTPPPIHLIVKIIVPINRRRKGFAVDFGEAFLGILG